MDKLKGYVFESSWKQKNWAEESKREIKERMKACNINVKVKIIKEDIFWNVYVKYEPIVIKFPPRENE